MTQKLTSFNNLLLSLRRRIIAALCRDDEHVVFGGIDVLGQISGHTHLETCLGELYTYITGTGQVISNYPKKFISIWY